jgi:hypothetical protein
MSCFFSTIVAAVDGSIPDPKKPNSKLLTCAIKSINEGPIEVPTALYTESSIILENEYYATGKFAFEDNELKIQIIDFVLIESKELISAGMHDITYDITYIFHLLPRVSLTTFNSKLP